MAVLISDMSDWKTSSTLLSNGFPYCATCVIGNKRASLETSFKDQAAVLHRESMGRRVGPGFIIGSISDHF